jgi:hypothetical protein
MAARSLGLPSGMRSIELRRLVLSITIPLFGCYPRIERFPCLHPHASLYTQSSFTLQTFETYHYRCTIGAAAYQIPLKYSHWIRR